MPPRPKYITVYKGTDGDWYWNLKAGNHRIIASSDEGHRRRRYVIRKVKKLHPNIQINIQDY